jgi:hypothetical protein
VAKKNVGWHWYATFLALNTTMVAGNFPRGGKNKRSVALKFATLAKGGTELSHGGKKNNVGWH